ncbi:serine/arginine repetitive matrix protein 1-like [Schistocerca gregaria]|uniref:serine/arginine repetitive matrix protein 1-like n=1 Tax=Schistocerca gregaria TaxID=7010 RepID=UPI00211E3302|nr:serine/arginine repetitive matrix protein 1-like [Schistocerca gregaria]
MREAAVRAHVRLADNVCRPLPVGRDPAHKGRGANINKPQAAVRRHCTSSNQQVRRAGAWQSALHRAALPTLRSSARAATRDRQRAGGGAERGCAAQPGGGSTPAHRGPRQEGGPSGAAPRPAHRPRAREHMVSRVPGRSAHVEAAAHRCITASTSINLDFVTLVAWASNAIRWLRQKKWLIPTSPCTADTSRGAASAPPPAPPPPRGAREPAGGGLRACAPRAVTLKPSSLVATLPRLRLIKAPPAPPYRNNGDLMTCVPRRLWRLKATPAPFPRSRAAHLSSPHLSFSSRERWGTSPPASLPLPPTPPPASPTPTLVASALKQLRGAASERRPALLVASSYPFLRGRRPGSEMNRIRNIFRRQGEGLAEAVSRRPLTWRGYRCGPQAPSAAAPEDPAGPPPRYNKQNGGNNIRYRDGSSNICSGAACFLITGGRISRRRGPHPAATR